MTVAPAPSCLVVAERRSESGTPAQAFPLDVMGLARALNPGKDLERVAAKRLASMIDTARRGLLDGAMLGLLLACETARGPSSTEPSAAGAAASVPGGRAPAVLNGGVGGNATRPTGSGASGMGGNDTGSGGTAGGGSSGGSSGASGRDPDPSSDDEQRYALWLGPGANVSAPRDVQRLGKVQRSGK